MKIKADISNEYYLTNYPMMGNVSLVVFNEYP